MRIHRFSKFRSGGRHPLWVVFLLWVGLAWTLPAFPQDNPPLTLPQQVKDWRKQLDEAEKALARAEISDNALVELRDRLFDLGLSARTAVEAVEPEVKTLRMDVESLGLPPLRDRERCECERVE